MYGVRQRGHELARFATEGEAVEFTTDLAVSDQLDVWVADADRHTLTLMVQARDGSPRYALTATLEKPEKQEQARAARSPKRTTYRILWAGRKR
jgi:hypothetical protein